MKTILIEGLHITTAPLHCDVSAAGPARRMTRADVVAFVTKAHRVRTARTSIEREVNISVVGLPSSLVVTPRSRCLLQVLSVGQCCYRRVVKDIK
jgi:hypothetical protein